MFRINILILLITSSLSLSSQTLIVQGRIINIENNRPVSTTVVFLNDSNKMIRTKSNSNDGSYQQAITYGKIYKILLSDYIPIKENEILDLTNYSTYNEINFDIKVRPIPKNYELLKAKIFEPNDSVITDTFFLNYLENFLLINKNAKVSFIISSEDSWFESKRVKMTVTNSRGRKITKRITLSTKHQLSELLDARIRNLKNLLQRNKLYFKEESFQKKLVISQSQKKITKEYKSGRETKYKTYKKEISNLRIIIN